MAGKKDKNLAMLSDVSHKAIQFDHMNQQISSLTSKTHWYSGENILPTPDAILYRDPSPFARSDISDARLPAPSAEGNRSHGGHRTV